MVRQMSFSLSVLASPGLSVQSLNLDNVSQPVRDGAPCCGWPTQVSGLRYWPTVVKTFVMSTAVVRGPFWGTTQGSMLSCTPKPWPSQQGPCFLFRWLPLRVLLRSFCTRIILPTLYRHCHWSSASPTSPEASHLSQFFRFFRRAPCRSTVPGL